MNTTRTAAALAGLGLVLSLSACSSSDTADANAAYCEGASKVESEVADDGGTSSSSGASADAVKAQWGAVQAAIEANAVPLTQLEDAVQEDVSAAYDTFTTAIEAIPADIPPSEAAPQYTAAIDGFTADIEAVKAEVGCS